MTTLIPVELSEMLGMTATVIFLNIGALDLPVVQVEAVIRVVNEAIVALELRSVLPGQVDARCRFGVYAEGRRGLVTFQSTLAEPYASGCHSLVLVAPRKVETLQRRRFPRVHFPASVTFHDALSRGRGTAVNISAGGLLFVSDTALRLGGDYLIDLQAPDGETLADVAARVTRCLAAPEGQWQVGVRFVDLPVAREMVLVKMVWREQIRQQKERMSRR